MIKNKNKGFVTVCHCMFGLGFSSFRMGFVHVQRCESAGKGSELRRKAKVASGLATQCATSTAEI